MHGWDETGMDRNARNGMHVCMYVYMYVCMGVINNMRNEERKKKRRRQKADACPCKHPSRASGRADGRGMRDKTGGDERMFERNRATSRRDERIRKRKTERKKVRR